MKTIIKALLIECICFAGYGQGTLQITFDGPPTIPTGANVSVTDYYEAGMSFTPAPGSYSFGRRGANPVSSSPDDGSAYLQALFAPAETLMFSFINGSLFNLVSVDLAEYSTVVPDPVTVQFIGYYADGSTITTSFTTDGIIDGTGPLADFQTFTFGSGWTGLSRVEIPSDGWSLDNLVVSIPEPTAGVLLLVGALALGAWKLRNRRR